MRVFECKSLRGFEFEFQSAPIHPPLVTRLGPTTKWCETTQTMILGPKVVEWKRWV